MLRWRWRLMGKWPDSPTRIDYFMDLFERVQLREYVRGYVNSTPLTLTADQNQAVDDLHDFRNQFLRFRPMDWSIEVRGFPRIVRHCLDVIEFICFGTGHVLYIDPELGEQAKNVIDRARSLVDEVEGRYSR
jgi:hypothetical protein